MSRIGKYGPEPLLYCSIKVDLPPVIESFNGHRNRRIDDELATRAINEAMERELGTERVYQGFTYKITRFTVRNADTSFPELIGVAYLKGPEEVTQE